MRSVQNALSRSTVKQLKQSKFNAPKGAFFYALV